MPSQVYIRNSTLVKPHALILMSSEMVVIPPGLEQENVPAGPVGAHPEDLTEDYDSGGEEKVTDDIILIKGLLLLYTRTSEVYTPFR